MSRQLTNGCRCPASLSQDTAMGSRVGVSRSSRNSTKSTRDGSSHRSRPSSSSQIRAQMRNRQEEEVEEGVNPLGSTGDAKHVLVPTQTGSWGNILRRQSSTETLSTFKKFDPLRTIHFLGKELKSQLRTQLPHESSVFEMLDELQNAIKRVPRDIESISIAAKRKHEYDLEPTKLTMKTGRTQACQTPDNWYLAPEKLQRHFDECTEKMEESCQQMEFLCSKVKGEKQSIERQMAQEKEISRQLSQQVEEHKLSHATAKGLIDTLKLRVEELELELQQQQIQMALQRSPSIAELSSFIEQLKGNIKKQVEENEMLKHKLQLSKLEIDKYDAIVQARDIQINQVRYEMGELQELMRDDLFDFLNNVSSEDVTNVASKANSAEHMWPVLQATTAPKTTGDSIYESIRSDPEHELEPNDQHHYVIEDHDVPRKRHVFKIPTDDRTSVNLRLVFANSKRKQFDCGGSSTSSIVSD